MATTGPGDQPRNELSGHVAGNVVQAQSVGQVHFRSPAPAPGGRPRQLPPAPGGFVNRVAELERLDQLLDRERDQPFTVVLSGLGGVGKSATGRRWAHQVSGRFADGQLYADLGALRHRGGVEVSDVLGGFLRALGVHEEWIPPDLPERAALFRSRTADLSLLVLVDDADQAAQVTPLVPASAASAVVVTSQRRLGGLVVGGATPFPLAPLGDGDAVRLLAGMIGEERAVVEPEAVAELARLCGGLPIALRVAGARLLQHPSWPVRRLVSELADGSRRLDRLASEGEPVVEAVFETAYRGLPPEAARLYRLLGLLPGPDFTGDLAGVLAGGEVRPLIETLLETHLVEEQTPDRYRLHDLVRLHAAHAAEGEPAAQRESALRRAVAWYSRMVAAADQLIMGRRFRLAQQPEHEGVFDDSGAALDWLEAERGNLLALLRLASVEGWDELVWQSAEAMWALYSNRKHYADWLETSRLGVLSAHRLGDQAAEARMRNQTARALIELADVDAAEAELDQARALAEDPRMQAVIIESAGLLDLAKGMPEAAAEQFADAARTHEEIGNTRGAGLQTYQLGRALAAAGRHQEAAEALERALGLAEGDELTQGKIAIALGPVYRLLGRKAEAVEALTKGAAVMRARRIPVKEVAAWKELAELAEDQETFRAHLTEAIRLCRASGNHAEADALALRLEN